MIRSIDDVCLNVSSKRIRLMRNTKKTSVTFGGNTVISRGGSDQISQGTQTEIQDDEDFGV